MSMRTARIVTLVATAALAAWSAHPSAAQQAGTIGLEVTAGYNLMGGDDFDVLDDAFGFEALGSYAFPTGLELGVGAGISTHDRPATDLDANMTNVFAEGRYRFGVPAPRVPHLHPFLAARVGWSSLSFDTASDDDASTTGLLIGGGGGLEYWLTDTVGIVGAALLHFLDYGSSDEVPGDISGREVDLRAGLKVRF